MACSHYASVDFQSVSSIYNFLWPKHTDGRWKVNAFNDAYFEELRRQFTSAHDDPAVRCIVLSSSIPKFFSAGLDLKAISLSNRHPETARNALLIRQHLIGLQEAVSSIEDCRVPGLGNLIGQNIALIRFRSYCSSSGNSAR